MEGKTFQIQQINFAKTSTRSFSSGKYYEILLIGKGDCYFELENNWVYCNMETAIFLKPGEKISMNFHQSRYPKFRYPRMWLG